MTKTCTQQALAKCCTASRRCPARHLFILCSFILLMHCTSVWVYAEALQVYAEALLGGRVTCWLQIWTRNAHLVSASEVVGFTLGRQAWHAACFAACCAGPSEGSKPCCPLIAQLCCPCSTKYIRNKRRAAPLLNGLSLPNGTAQIPSGMHAEAAAAPQRLDGDMELFGLDDTVESFGRDGQPIGPRVSPLPLGRG